MQRTFEGKTNLRELTKCIAQFFEVREFDNVTAVQTEKGYEIVAENSRKYKIAGDMKVSLDEGNGVFSVSLCHTKEKKRFNYPMMLATMFGAGYFFLKDMKSDESWHKIERELWQQITNMITQTRDTVNGSQEHVSTSSEHQP